MKIILALFLTLSIYAQPISLPTTSGTSLNMDITSSSLQISGYEDKFIVLEFFGKRCPVCRQMAPTIEELNKHEDIQVIGIHMQADIDDSALNSYMSSQGINFPVINYNQSYAPYTLAKAVAPDWQLQIPFMLFIDKGGRVISYAMGNQSYDQIIDAFKTYGSMK